MVSRKHHKTMSAPPRDPELRGIRLKKGASMIPKLLLFTALVTFGSLPASAQNAIAITGAKLLTVTQGVIENGTLVVESGRIAAIGADVRVPPDARVIDARGKVVMPGMIDAGDELGLVEIPAEQITLDATDYKDPDPPELRV